MATVNEQPQLPIKGQPAIRVAMSDKRDPVLAAQDIYEGLDQQPCACVMFFCSADYDLQTLSKEIAKRFGDTQVVGCTTAGEITPLGYTQNSITGFSFPQQNFVVETMLLKNLASFSVAAAEKLVRDMVQGIKSRTVAPVSSQSFALSLLDGMSIREELVLNALSTALNDIPLVGGSAGDNLHFKDTHVYYDGEFHSNAAVMILVNSRCRFKVFSAHHLLPEQEKLVVTKADPFKRVVQEFNAEPAALEYCRMTGLTLEQLNPRIFALHPLAVQFGEDLYVRAIQQQNDDLSLTFFCAVDVGIVLTKMQSSGLVAHTKSSLNEITKHIGKPQLVIGYDCIHRRIEADEKNLCEALSKIYRQHNVIGFNTYGEQRDAMHINHTLTGVAIGFEEYE